jgi:hypothetical protein
VAGTSHDSLNVSNQATFIPEIWAARALNFLHQNCIMMGLVNRDWENEVAQYGDTINIQSYGTFEVKDKVAGQATQPQTTTSDNLAIVLNQHKEITFVIESVARAQSKISIMDGYIKRAMQAHTKAMDKALLLAAYATLPAANRFGNASAALAKADMIAARRFLNLKEIPDDNRHWVFLDDAGLLNIDTFTRNDSIGDGSAIKTGVVGYAYGSPVRKDPRVWQVGDSPAGVHNLYFHSDGITLCTRPLEQPEAGLGVKSYVANMDGIGLRITSGYSLDKLGYQVTIDILYGIKVISTDYLTEIITSE